ncbi:MAG: hypothetical protein A3K10_02895 [Bacteroidetes bacterium RIFCSPLOWO2_12_FULL_31_6]|nr:MAG: hypothetical protein A3K10_02895 [Bacteroidetes bacterium RIFCSPLOWO2_12_FULL_31_6]
MKYWLLLLLSAARISFIFSQDGQGYYHDYTNNFYVFDKGIERQVESNRVSNILTGNNYVAFFDPKLSFVYYYNGEKQVLEENIPNQIVATPTALVYKMQERLMICENGEKKLLARKAETFFATDSLIIWQALPSLDFMAYENGETKTIVTAINSSVINDFKVGSNIMAFNDLNYDLNIFFKGQLFNTNNSRVTSYACAHNIVAFLDEYKNTFSVFYNGSIKILSKEIIKEYAVSNDLVAYVDAKDNFYIFYDGVLTKIDSRSPDYFSGKGNVFYYSYSSELKIVYQGEIYSDQLVDQQSIIIGENSLLYYSNINRPKYFYKGKIIDNFYVQKPYAMELKQDLPVFKYNNTIGFLYNGKIHEFAVRSN